MKKKSGFIFALFIASKICFAQDGSSCEKPLIIFPSSSCENSDGIIFYGNMQCPTADCSSYITMSGSSGNLDPDCSPDNEKIQSAVWIKVRATAENFTINNGMPYIGSGAANANTKDYTVYTGTCGNLTQIECHTLIANSSATITGLVTGQDYFIMASPATTHTSANAISMCITSTVAYEAPGNSCSQALELTINSIYTFNNAGATTDGPSTPVSMENNTWYKWETPSDWPGGQSAFVRLFEPVCNSSEGLQAFVWTTNGACPGISDKPSPISKISGTSPEYYYQWTPQVNTSYYISVDGYAGTACEFNLQIGAQSTVPVNLISFDARSDGNSVLLTWLTSEETNNSFFTLEKSRDGRNFLPLNTVEGAGKSTTDRTYNSRDEYPFTAVNYYRLKQTDSRGHYTYSKNVAVDVKGEGRIFHARSSMKGDNIDIGYFSTEKEPAILRIMDKSGRQLYCMNLQLSQGRNDYKIHSQFFSEGTYQIKLETPTAILSKDILLEEE